MDIQSFSARFNTSARRDAFLSLVKDSKRKNIFIQGLEGSAPALLFSNLLENKKPHLIIANDLDEAGYLYNDLVQINGSDRILLFPSGYKRDIKYGQPDPPSEILRTEVLNRLNQKGDSLLVITYPEALAEKVVPVDTLSDQTLHIDKKSKYDIVALADKLRELGFSEVDYVYEPGQFAVRGSILDVFSFTNELPYRIDFFGKEVESIRTFEVETQLSTERLDEVYIVSNVCGKEASGISMLDFIDKNAILVCHNLSWALDRIEAVASESLSEQTLIAEEGDRDAMKKIIDPAAFRQKALSFRRIDYGTSSEAKTPAVMRFDCAPQGVYHKNFDLVSQSFSQFIEKKYTIYILSDSEKQIERLQAIFEERGESITFTPVLKTLHEGFVDNDLKIYLEGSNTINSVCSGIRSDDGGTLIIDGGENSTLTIDSVCYGIRMGGFSSTGVADMTINGANIDITTVGESGRTGVGIQAEGNLKVSGSEITVDAQHEGLIGNASVSISSSSVSVVSTEYEAILSNYGVSISEGSDINIESEWMGITAGDDLSGAKQ